MELNNAKSIDSLAPSLYRYSEFFESRCQSTKPFLRSLSHGNSPKIFEYHRCAGHAHTALAFVVQQQQPSVTEAKLDYDGLMYFPGTLKGIASNAATDGQHSRPVYPEQNEAFSVELFVKGPLVSQSSTFSRNSACGRMLLLR